MGSLSAHTAHWNTLVERPIPQWKDHGIRQLETVATPGITKAQLPYNAQFTPVIDITDYDGIYAQAYALWKQGFRYWFDDEENAELERHNRQFEEPNMEEELILTYLHQPYGEEIKNNQRQNARMSDVK